MTSYSSMGARGREESARVTTGRRKRIAERIEYDEATTNYRTPLGHPVPPYVTVSARLVGSCGHTLRWLAAVPVRDGEPHSPYYLTSRLGRRMTCQHDDCRIPPPGAPA